MSEVFEALKVRASTKQRYDAAASMRRLTRAELADAAMDLWDLVPERLRQRALLRRDRPDRRRKSQQSAA